MSDNDSAPQGVDTLTLPIDLLDRESLSLVLENLSLKEYCVLACVRRTLREFVNGHHKWKELLHERFWSEINRTRKRFLLRLTKRSGHGVHASPAALLASPSEYLSSFKEAFIAWEIRFGGYAAVFTRGWNCWSTIETWTRTTFEPVYHSLAEGASEEQLNEAEQSLDVTFPRAMRMMYRVHNGQDLSIDRNHIKLVVDITDLCRRHEYLTSSEKVVIAACKTLRKLFILDTSNGNVYAACMNRKLEERAHEPFHRANAVPIELMCTFHPSTVSAPTSAGGYQLGHFELRDSHDQRTTWGGHLLCQSRNQSLSQSLGQSLAHVHM
eukprot:1315896-Pyramimonas_sp.AAC.1